MIEYIWARLASLPERLRRGNHSHLTLELDADALESLRKIARREGRTLDELASELLHLGIVQRQEAELYLQQWHDLSRREKQVAALICMNFTTREIADRLIISPETVKSHVRNILNKTGLRNRSELRRALADWDFKSWLRTQVNSE